MVDSLWRTLRSGAQQLRRFLIIDACFAAASVRHMMGRLEEAVKVKVRDLLDEEGAQAVAPDRGTAVLCSSSAKDTASMAGTGGVTQFTDGLMQVLSAGSEAITDRLSLAQVHALVKASLSARYKENAVVPELHAPDQRLLRLPQDVPVSLPQNVPIFPNVGQRVKPITRQLKENYQTLATEAEFALKNDAASPEDLKLWNERLAKAVKDRPLDWQLTRVKSFYDAGVDFRLRDATNRIKGFLSKKDTAGDIDEEYADALFILACYKLRLVKKRSTKDYAEVIETLKEAIEIRPEIRGWIDSDPEFRTLKTNSDFIKKLDTPPQATANMARVVIQNLLASRKGTAISFQGIRDGSGQNWDDAFLSGLILEFPHIFRPASLKPGRRPGLKLAPANVQIS
jgi:hypothetical protein